MDRPPARKTPQGRAILHAGRTLSPELAYQFADCGAALLVYAPEQAAVVAGIRGEAALRHLLALAGPAAAPGWANADTSSLRMLLCGGARVPDATIRR